jgi:Ca2+-binding EF-hand superfamily protein
MRGTGAVQDAFRQADFDCCGELNREDFVDALNYGSLFLSKADVSVIFASYDPARKGTIKYDDFLVGLVGTLSAVRYEVVCSIWNKLEQQGASSIEGAISSFNASRHPQVLSGSISVDECTGRFSNFFYGLDFSRDTFLAYFTELSACIPSDDYFGLITENCWGISSGSASERKSDPMFLFIKDLREKVRQKTHGSNERERLRQAFKFFDEDESGFIQPPEFCKSLERFGIRLPLLERLGNIGVDRAAAGSRVAPGGGAGVKLDSLLALCDTNGDGTINYIQFLREIFGDEYAE